MEYYASIRKNEADTNTVNRKKNQIKISLQTNKY